MNNQSHKPNNTPKLIGAGIVSVAVVAAVLFFLMGHTGASQTASNTAATSSPIVISTPAASGGTSSAAVKDGTYTASADYDVPGDTNTIAVTLTVKNGAISAVSTQNTYGERESARYISSFKNSISGMVVGKSLQDAGVGRVSGASDTSRGFDDALQSIVTQATS